MNRTITLPNLTLHSTHLVEDSELVILSGGRDPNPTWFKKIIQGRDLWCVDHGIDFCAANNIIPSFLIGDGDSALSKNWEWAKQQKIPLEIHPVEKDFTDTQLALQTAICMPHPPVLIMTGVFGGRFDHAYSTIFSAGNAPLPCILTDDRETIFFLKNNQSISLFFHKLPVALSLIPISEKVTGISSEGLHWQLNNCDIEQNFPNTISNRLENTSSCSIAIKQGTLAVYICWKETERR